MTIYLYVKTHRKTGLKYLGKTEKPDPYAYEGSGLHWSRHIKKHGYDVDTEIIRECSDYDDLKYWGSYYSQLWNIVESKEWANLKPETGDGGDMSMCENWHVGMKNRIIPSQAGIPKSAETRANMSKAKQGIPPPNFNQWVRAAKGKSYYNNGSEESRFLPDSIPSGWIKGRLQLQCKCGKSVDISNLKKYHKDC